MPSERGEGPSSGGSRRSAPHDAAEEAHSTGPAAAPTERRAPARARLALGLVRMIALVGIAALAVIAGAILVSEDVDGWIVGLVLGVGAQVLTIFVLFSRRFETFR